jgi:hypothetical protein
VADLNEEYTQRLETISADDSHPPTDEATVAPLQHAIIADGNSQQYSVVSHEQQPTHEQHSTYESVLSDATNELTLAEGQQDSALRASFGSQGQEILEGQQNRSEGDDDDRSDQTIDRTVDGTSPLKAPPIHWPAITAEETAAAAVGRQQVAVTELNKQSVASVIGNGAHCRRPWIPPGRASWRRLPLVAGSAGWTRQEAIGLRNRQLVGRECHSRPQNARRHVAVGIHRNATTTAVGPRIGKSITRSTANAKAMRHVEITCPRSSSGADSSFSIFSVNGCAGKRAPFRGRFRSTPKVVRETSIPMDNPQDNGVSVQQITMNRALASNVANICTGREMRRQSFPQDVAADNLTLRRSFDDSPTVGLPVDVRIVRSVAKLDISDGREQRAVRLPAIVKSADHFITDNELACHQINEYTTASSAAAASRIQFIDESQSPAAATTRTSSGCRRSNGTRRLPVVQFSPNNELRSTAKFIGGPDSGRLCITVAGCGVSADAISRRNRRRTMADLKNGCVDDHRAACARLTTHRQTFNAGVRRIAALELALDLSLTPLTEDTPITLQPGCSANRQPERAPLVDYSSWPLSPLSGRTKPVATVLPMF